MEKYTLSEILSFKQFFTEKCSSISEFIDEYNALVLPNVINNKNQFRPNRNYNRYNRGVNNQWKNKKNLSTGDALKFSSTIWKKDETLKEIDIIRMNLNKELNKLCETQFNQNVKNILIELEKVKCKEVFNLIINLIIEKVQNDKNYLDLYSRLCYNLSNNYNWQYSIFTVENYKDLYFYSINSTDEDIEPNMENLFGSREEALNDGLSKISFKRVLFERLNEEHKKLDDNIEKINGFDCENSVIEKNKVINLYSFIGYLHSVQLLHDYIIYSVLLSLLQNKKELSIEIFLEVYNIISKYFLLFPEYNKEYFKMKIKQLIDENHYSSKIIFKVEDIFGIKKILENKKDIILQKKSNCTSEILSLLSDVEESGDNVIDDYDLTEFTDEKICSTIIELLISGKCNLNIGKRVFYKLSKNINISNVLNSFLEDIEEIEIDYPNSRKILESFLE